MTALMFLLGAGAGGGAAWWLASQRAAEMLMQARAAMHREIRHWQEAAARANSEVERLAREAQSWSAGHQQGREDVISIVPLLVAAQQRPVEQPPAADA
jgi:predicted  nucleic acid-binding Zn-ribbon protein